MHISDLDSLRSNPMIRFKTEMVDDQPFTIVHYMISNTELWNNPAALEARGNTYDDQGHCVCACFKKFFNVNERPETQESRIKNNIQLCLDKRDGSLVTPILTQKGSIRFKTKKSFYSDTALLVNQCVPESVQSFSRDCLNQHWTPLFEFTHPDIKIVIDYGNEPQFTLIGIRSHQTGDEMSYSDMQSLCKGSGVSLIPSYPFTEWTTIKQYCDTQTGIEGLVLILKDGQRVKIKTAEYFKLHILNTDICERDIAKAVAYETLDDIWDLVNSTGSDRSHIERIESRVIAELTQISNELEDCARQCDGLTLKDIALAYTKHPLFSLIMAKVRNKEPNIVRYWETNFLKNYSLRSVYSKNF